MTNIIFRFSGFLVTFVALGLVVLIARPDVACAQYHGAYPGHKDKKAEKEKPLYPQVFSSHVTSIQQTRKLDELYDNLYASLWNYAISDFNYQKQLYALIENENFQITRYSSEFSGVLEKAMENLNDNHGKMKTALENAQNEYQYVLERVRESDKATLEKLWEERIAEYQDFADKYFEMQHLYLKTYHKLVSFVLAQGGKYYYKKTDRSLNFFNYGAYEYYGKMVDTLRMTSYEQQKLLKSHIPASMNMKVLK